MQLKRSAVCTSGQPCHMRTAALAVRRVQSPHLTSPFKSRRSMYRQAEPDGKLSVSPAQDNAEEADGLLVEEDQEVPGGYDEAMNPNTKLGKAVRAACDELEHLNSMELDILNQAEEVLKKMGYKASLFDVPAGLGSIGEDEGGEQAVAQEGAVQR